MKRLVALLSSATILSVSAASAQSVVYDGFSVSDYTDGATVDSLGGGAGWDGNWSVDTSANESNLNRYWASSYSLGYTDTHGNNLVTSPGSLELRAAGSGAGALNRPFSEPASGEVWFSFLNIRTTDDSWNYDLQFLDAGGGIQFRIQNDGSGNFRLNQDGGSVASLDIVNHTTDEEPQGQLFVGQLTNVGSGSADSTMTVWVNPDNLLDLSEGAEAVAALTDREVSALASFNFDKGANTTGFFDEFRIGASAGEVMPIPEPATYAWWLAAVTAGVLLWRRRAARSRVPA